MIGHKGHPEVEGTMGQSESGMYLVETTDDVEALTVQDPTKLSYVTQTTLSIDDAASIVDALKRKFPLIEGPRSDSICYATQNRQDAVKIMAKDCDLVIIVGSPNSSNSNRLREVAQNQGVESYMVDNADHLNPEWIIGKRHIGISAGASAPEILVQEVIAKLKSLGAAQVSELQGVVEHVVFQLPKNLRTA